MIIYIYINHYKYLTLLETPSTESWKLEKPLANNIKYIYHNKLLLCVTYFGEAASLTYHINYSRINRYPILPALLITLLTQLRKNLTQEFSPLCIPWDVYCMN